MIINCSLENFRKDFNKNFQGFYLRIREDSNDIAYYNGTRAFKVSINDEKSIKITIPKDVYELNATNVRNSKENGIDIVNIINDLKNKYFDEKLIEVIIKKGPKSYDKNNHLKTREAFKNIKKSLGKNLKYFENELNDDLVNKILDSFDNGESSETIKVSSYGEDLKVEFIFIENCGEKYGFAKPKFKYEEIITEKTIKLEDLYKDTKNAIEKYEEGTRINLEKKYQHQFILGAHNSSLLNIYPFEEEYYIKEKKTGNISSDEKNGRIDGVLYKRKGNILEDIYLIELKVNEKVVAGDNGVLTHLDDIKNLIINTDFNNIDEKNFFYILKDRIEYRIKALEDSKFQFKNNKNKIDFKVHFYTIMGFTNNNSKEKVIKYLEAFKTKEGVNNLIETGKLCEKEPEKFKNKDIYDICNPLKEKCDIKFFFDENEWNEKTDFFTPNFKDITSMYFEGINNE